MKKWIYCLVWLIATSSSYGIPLRKEVADSRMIRSALYVASRLSYEDSRFVHGEVQRLPREARRGTALVSEDLERYFHDDAGAALPAYKNCFEGGDVRGCIYSVQDPRFANKFFIAFPGTQTLAEWAKNFFGIVHFDTNIQRSYDHDIRNIYAHQGPKCFLTALYTHINAQGTDYRECNNDAVPVNLGAYEYYFTGHSRGGGLAWLAGIRFKERNPGIPLDNLKVATFCTPRLTNAHSAQADFMDTLGHQNTVHFVRPSDLAPKFPFRFVENQGAQILLQPSPFWAVIKAHRMPNYAEMESSIEEYNRAKGVGWTYPIRTLCTLDAKSLAWGAGGIGLTLLATKTGLGSLVIEGLREAAFGIIYIGIKIIGG